jgi:hypothetical protein
MSSTNQIGGKRNKDDYYRTPAWAIREFMEAFNQDIEKGNLNFLDSSMFDPFVALDPCAGGDSNNPMPYPLEMKRWPAFKLVMTNDIRVDSPADSHEDFLTSTANWAPRPNLIISNPPFIHAREFIDRALEVISMGGCVVMLARLNFFGSQDRKLWWQDRMPTLAYVHSRRMQFMDRYPEGHAKFGLKPGGDSCEYVHLVWIKGKNPRFAQLRVI